MCIPFLARWALFFGKQLVIVVVHCVDGCLMLVSQRWQCCPFASCKPWLAQQANPRFAGSLRRVQPVQRLWSQFVCVVNIIISQFSVVVFQCLRIWMHTRACPQSDIYWHDSHTHTYLYVYLHAPVNARFYLHMIYTFIYKYIFFVYFFQFIHAHKFQQVDMHMYIYIDIYLCIYMLPYRFSFTYIHTHKRYVNI